MTQPTTQKKAPITNPQTFEQPELLPAVANYLKVLNEQVLPAFLKTGSLLNAINARDGLANLTHNFVTKPITLPLIIDGIIEAGKSTIGKNSNENSYDVPVRIFYPSVPTIDNSSNSLQTSSKPPIMIYFHGGGGTAGSVSVYHHILCRLAKYTEHIVIAPEYRLAPENPYPCGQDDACTVLLGVKDLIARRNIATNGSIVVAGDSHGGALVANLLRDSRLKQSGIFNEITAQVLIYPSVDFSMSYPSIDKYASGYLLSKEKIYWYFEQYFQNGENKQKQSVLFASEEELKQQPPALVISAKVDPLYDEGMAYANKLKQAGVTTQHTCYGGVLHGYLNMEDINPDVCKQTYYTIADFLHN